MRAVEVLEQLGTPEARQLLEELAAGARRPVDVRGCRLAPEVGRDKARGEEAAVKTTTHGAISFTGAGSFRYTPDRGYVGPARSTYTASDGILSSDITSVYIDVTDNAPQTSPASYNVEANQTLSAGGSWSVLASDTDPDGDALTASLVAGCGPMHGEVTLHSDGSFSYTPDMNCTGTDSFEYAASDGVVSSRTAGMPQFERGGLISVSAPDGQLLSETNERFDLPGWEQPAKRIDQTSHVHGRPLDAAAFRHAGPVSCNGWRESPLRRTTDFSRRGRLLGR